MKINEETTVSEEQVLFNKLSYEEQQFILKQMRLLQPCELRCEVEEEKKIPEKLENEKEFYAYTRYEENKDEIDKILYILKAINLTEEKIDNLNNSINSIIDYLKSKGDE